MRKRIVVGCMVLAWCVTPIFIHPTAIIIQVFHLYYIICNEGFHLAQKEFETTWVYQTLKRTFIILVFFAISTKCGPFDRKIIENSGFSPKTHPIMFAILFDYHILICFIGTLFLFILSMNLWRRRNLRFQLRKAIAVICQCLVFALVAGGKMYTSFRAGRWWTYFAVLQATLNDAMAYFAGRAFGKHHLIGLSPNKTIEGFLGGAIANVIAGYFLSKKYLVQDFYYCPAGRLNYGLFEEWRCVNGVAPIYQEQEYQLPFEIMGYSSFYEKPAVIYSTIYALFASLIAPFVGFFASGFKRSIGIKDFADTLPGHGGFTDRMDCVSIMSLFNFFFIQNIILRDELETDSVYYSTNYLSDSDKLAVMNSIAERFGLSPGV